MTDDEDVVGTIVVQDEDGFFKLPRKYANANGGIVYRDPSKTVDLPKGTPFEHFWFDPRSGRNPDLSPDLVSLKFYSEDRELYRVENPDRVDVPDGFEDDDGTKA